MSQALDCTIPACVTCGDKGFVACDLGGLARRCPDCAPLPEGVKGQDEESE